MKSAANENIKLLNININLKKNEYPLQSYPNSLDNPQAQRNPGISHTATPQEKFSYPAFFGVV